MGVVPSLDVVEQLTLRVAAIGQGYPTEQLAFQRGEEAFTQGVVVRIAYGPHGPGHDQPTALGEGLTGILRPVVRVMNHAVGTTALKSHVQRGNQAMAGILRHSQRKRGATDRPDLGC